MSEVHATLNLLGTPVWIVSASTSRLTFANDAAKALSADGELASLRNGALSAHAEERIASCIPILRARQQIVEIWTILRDGEVTALSCRLSLLNADEILVEGILSSLPAPTLVQEDTTGEEGIFDALFQSNNAPMLLIDPEADGRIVDANQTAASFYGYPRSTLCQLHTWQINALGRDVMPVMGEVAKLPGGHKPLNFVHRLADGSLRNVQTYAGPLMHKGKRLMFCVVHDVTEQKRLKAELEHAATKDPLTGLWNRRHLVQMLETARNLKRRHDQSYCVMLLDADHFKALNDQYGHHAGDETLVSIARILETRVRAADAVCRWGGEEFLVLLPQTGLNDAAALAEYLRASVEERHLAQLPPITVSIGVAQQQADETTESLLKRADIALYRAKHLGRNRVEVA